MGTVKQYVLKVAAKDFVGALARQHHLDAHFRDFAGQEEHRRGRPDRGDICREKVIRLIRIDDQDPIFR